MLRSGFLQGILGADCCTSSAVWEQVLRHSQPFNVSSSHDTRSAIHRERFAWPDESVQSYRPTYGRTASSGRPDGAPAQQNRWCFAQQLVILIFLPTQIEFGIKKVFSNGLVALKLFEALDNTQILPRAYPSTFPLANLATAFKHLNRAFIVAQKLRKDLEYLPVLVR